jgi:hypothetical protein
MMLSLFPSCHAEIGVYRVAMSVDEAYETGLGCAASGAFPRTPQLNPHHARRAGRLPGSQYNERKNTITGG